MDSTQTMVNSLNNTVNSTLAAEEDSYDSYGAMLFIIAVIIVYGVAVICMLGFYSGREVHMEDFDKQADSFLKEVDDRHRQLDIRSRKSAFTKRLSELRSELSQDQAPHIHSHVANYLIASIGMNSKRNKKRSLNFSSISLKGKSSTTRRHSTNSLSSRNVSVLKIHGRSKSEIPIVRITDNNKVGKVGIQNYSPELIATESPFLKTDKNPITSNSKSYISMQDNSIETRSAQEVIYISGSVDSVFTSDSRLTRIKKNFMEIFACIADGDSSQTGSGYLLHSSRKAMSDRNEESEELIVLEYETVV